MQFAQLAGGFGHGMIQNYTCDQGIRVCFEERRIPVTRQSLISPNTCFPGPVFE